MSSLEIVNKSSGALFQMLSVTISLFLWPSSIFIWVWLY